MNPATRFCLVALLIGGSIAGAANAAEPDKQAPHVNPADSFSVVQASLETAGGNLTPDVRAAYVDWAERTVLAGLSNTPPTALADSLVEVRADPVLRDAMFAAVDPPDPTILLNYAALRSELGPEFLAKYRALVIATAVANRHHGAKVRPDINHEAEALDPPSPQKTAAEKEIDRMASAIADFMTQKHLAALDLCNDLLNEGKSSSALARRQELASFLQIQGFDKRFLARLDKPERFHDLLKQAMVKLGQRPAKREPPPADAPWLRYLASVFESTPASSPTLDNGRPAPWPRFPINQAPWPLLMPLTHAYPLEEARYIFETYEGRHGPDRYHTYGPFQGGDPERIAELCPSPWHWKAWPDVIVHGGDCTVMAPMSVETHVTLGEPAVMAGQPGHCNLISVRQAGGFWFGVLEQAFAGGPDVTLGSWLFNEIGNAPGLQEENDRPWAASEYQIGLAQAMNTGLPQYIDTRIAVALFNRLPADEKPTLGKKLLTQAIQTNPYNPAPWELLALQTTDASQGLLLADWVTTKRRESAAAKSYPPPVKQAVQDYWSVLADRIAWYGIVRHPVPKDNATRLAAYDFLKSASYPHTPRGWVDTPDPAWNTIVSDKGILLEGTERMVTPGSFRPPVAISIEAKTDSTNLRVAYAADQVIFNWEVDHNQLRVDGGPAGGEHKPGAGSIPIDKYVLIRWVVTPTQQSIYVDDRLRYKHTGDYSHLDKPVSVFPAEGSRVTVKSIRVTQLPSGTL